MTPPGDAETTANDAVRGSRIFAPKIAARPVDKAILDVPTVFKDGERESCESSPSRT